MEIDEPYLEWVPCIPETMVQKYLALSRNVSLGIGSYYMPVVLAQRHITLVLMMINSCSYSLLIILCLNSFSD